LLEYIGMSPGNRIVVGLSVGIAVYLFPHNGVRYNYGQTCQIWRFFHKENGRLALLYENLHLQGLKRTETAGSDSDQ